ncbi:DUF3846 domain-containing protein [Allofournierella massiliensis]|uniref:Uncharacterized protein DUF3846 n=1 Tax=Allofournierella massiliensis TaxID=1650663 RepID=A0A4R1QGE7_9FIRM|nr:DUF3846 domain-containing protein [Fournierella massiliensis]TCL52588.1 uncharacterized protein DUF3846 [Fournierella massiliensis]
MDVLLFEPGKYPRSVSVDTLEEMQQLVGGWITATYPFDDPVAVVANDEGLLLDLPFNRMVDPYHPIVGNFFLAGIGTEDFISLSPELMEKYEKALHDPQILVRNSREPLQLAGMPVTPQQYQWITHNGMEQAPTP